MDLITKTYVRPSQKVSTIVKDNPLLLLVLENFSVTRIGKDLTVAQLCKTMGINVNLFILICNLHNGFYIEKNNKVTVSDIPAIINYLSLGHRYYLKEKYPEIRGYIRQIGKSVKSNFISVMESYFDEYFREVKEHILYEEKVAFPYFMTLPEKASGKAVAEYSSYDYQGHHSDIESSLEAFRDLFIQYTLTQSQAMKRKLLMSLSELEFALKVHAHIEEMVLIPLTRKLEKKNGKA